MSAEAQGCTYTKHPDQPPCNKVCDPGYTLCPHHILLTQAEANGVAAKKPPASSKQTIHQTPRGYEQ
jgi:hypothetical protein